MTSASTPTSSPSIAVSRADVVAADIERLIAAGDLRPGDRIHEINMAERFGVSRGPVREACRLLAAKGLVSITPRHGAFVRTLTFQEIVEIFDVRAALGRLAGIQATSAIEKPDLERLDQLISDMDEKVRDGDSAGYTDLNLEFHDVLYAVSGNERLHALDRSFGGELRMYRQRGAAFGGLAVSNNEHKGLLACLRRGDARAAGEALEQHIANGRERFIRAFAAQGTFKNSHERKAQKKVDVES